MWSTVLAIAIAAALLIRFVVLLRRAKQRKRAAGEHFKQAVAVVLSDVERLEGPDVGLPKLEGRYRDHVVQINPVIDTLAVRKLPSLWLLITLPEPLPVKATFDLMMRPAGPTTFSNFEFLPDEIPLPIGYPREAVLRSDRPAHLPPLNLIAPHLDIFVDRRAKELLIAPKGIRIVWQLAEADRARYGVFREAEFGDYALDAQVLRALLDHLLTIRQTLLDWAGQHA